MPRHLSIAHILLWPARRRVIVIANVPTQDVRTAPFGPVPLGSIAREELHQVFKLCRFTAPLGVGYFIEKPSKHDMPAIPRQRAELVRPGVIGAFPPLECCDEHFQVRGVLVSERHRRWNGE